MEPATIKTSSGKKSIAKRRIRAIRENGKGCEVVLNTYKEMLDRTSNRNMELLVIERMVRNFHFG